MVKRILLSIVLLLVIVYLVVAVTALNRKPATQVCHDVELVIKDTVYAGFITKKEVATLLEKKGISPVGKDPPKTSDAGVLGYAAMALLGLTGSALCLRRKEDEIA